MTTPAQLDLVFLWHMHQPDYRDPRDGRYVLPWTYLHGIKDYTDMAAHLERHPGLRAVVNFVPVLVEQIDEYARSIAAGVPCDPLLALLAREDFTTLSDAERDLVSTACFRANHHHMLEPFPPYRRLRDLDALVGDDASPRHYLSGRYYADLVTWYHLVWLGESVRRDQPWVVDLIGKGGDYSSAERRRLFDLVGCELGRIAARYRALRDRGQVELSTTPYAHPLGPLLFGFSAAREAVPDLALPAHPAYPDGAARFAEHCRLARTLHDSRFGAPPRGAWPAEGALSAPVLEALGDHDFAWTASGEAVLAHTLRAAGRSYDRLEHLYRPWRDASGVTVFFRDDRLSDLIGFEYSRWDAYDAARHFVGELDRIRTSAPAGDTPVVCVALDGENAWEYYPYNAYYFFEALYEALAEQPAIRTTTFASVLDCPRQRTRVRDLPRVCAGSWVYGTLTTWMGDPDKNLAWDLLCEAKLAYDARAPALSPAARANADRLLRVCEGSDWFWWFGDYNPAASVANFERLFRANLEALYMQLDLVPPAALTAPLSRGSMLAGDAGTMRRSNPAP